MTKTELESALIAAGWINPLSYDPLKYFNKSVEKSDKIINITNRYFILCIHNTPTKCQCRYSDCRLIENIPLKDGTHYRAIICDIDGLFLRLEL